MLRVKLLTLKKKRIFFCFIESKLIEAHYQFSVTVNYFADRPSTNSLRFKPFNSLFYFPGIDQQHKPNPHIKSMEHICCGNLASFRNPLENWQIWPAIAVNFHRLIGCQTAGQIFRQTAACNEIG